MKLRDVDYKILYELMKNAKMSDRKLAKKIGVSQPTVTRRRARLEKEKLIEYAAIPDLEKLGYQIMAFNFSKWTTKALTEVLPAKEFDKQVQLFFSKYPNVIFAATGIHGVEGMNSVSISIHKDYSSYHRWTNEIKTTWAENIAKFDSYVVSLKDENIVRQITMKYLPKYIEQTRVDSTLK